MDNGGMRGRGVEFMSGRGRKRFLTSHTLLTVLIVLPVLIALSSCTRKVLVPVENTITRTDTLLQTQLRVDSFWQHDSVVVMLKGDTVRIAEYHFRDKVKMVRDTLYKSVTDTARIAVPYPVERKLTRWERIKQEAGGVAIIAEVVAIAILAVWLFRRRE